MKSKILFAMAMLFMIGNIIGQDSEKSKPTGYISINGGFGIPLGDYSNEYIGGALSGGSFHLNYSAPLFKSHFGLTTKIDMGVYEMSTTPFISEQKKLISSFGYIDKVDYSFKTVSYGSYSQTNILTGLYTTIPLKRISIDARILAGFNFTNRPKSVIDFDFNAINYTERYYENASSSSSFAYDFGFGVRYNMGKKQKLCLMVSFDFIGAYGDFNFESKRLYDDGSGFVDDTNIQKMHSSYSVSTWTTTFGIGYVIGNKNK